MYKIIRFYNSGQKDVVNIGLTIEEAKEHCESNAAAGDGWIEKFEKD